MSLHWGFGFKVDLDPKVGPDQIVPDLGPNLTVDTKSGDDGCHIPVTSVVPLIFAIENLVHSDEVAVDLVADLSRKSEQGGDWVCRADWRQCVHRGLDGRLGIHPLREFEGKLVRNITKPDLKEKRKE